MADIVMNGTDKEENKEIRELKEQIKLQEENIEKASTELGKKYFALFKDSPDEKLSSDIQKIKSFHKKIVDLETAILRARGIVKCSKCGSENSIKARFCSKCGTPLMDIVSIKEQKNVAKPAFCMFCGNALYPDALFCSNCGNKVMNHMDTFNKSSAHDADIVKPEPENDQETTIITETDREVTFDRLMYINNLDEIDGTSKTAEDESVNNTRETVWTAPHIDFEPEPVLESIEPDISFADDSLYASSEANHRVFHNISEDEPDDYDDKTEALN